MVRIRGKRAPDGVWEGWIEFDSPAGSPMIRSPVLAERETREDLVRWATGLPDSLLRDVLSQAVAPKPPPAALDPFATYEKGERVLRSELEALDAEPLRDILRVYDPVRSRELHLGALRHAMLVELIVAAARWRKAPSPDSDPLPSS